MTRSQYSAPGSARILVLSLMLLFFAISHTLEDFALGEPAKAGVSAPVLSFAIALMIALQAVGIYWLGQGLRRGALVHVAIGLFWPIAAGMAQLPIIVTGAPYRAGAFSVLYVGGMIVVGLLVSTSALVALIKKNL